MTPFSLHWVIEKKDDEKFIKHFLSEHDISRRALTDIKFNGGFIKVNGKEENVRYRLTCGDSLEVIFPAEERSESLITEDIPLQIIYEDPYILVINKPPYMSTIPSREHPSGSLANALMGYYRRNSVESSAHIVTRLDRNTSGLVLIAKHRHIHHLCGLMQQGKKIKRVYQALVEGVFFEKSGTIEEPIGRKETSIIEREVRQDGQYACTHFEVLKQFEDFCHIKLWLETGRTHQIRVHMSFIGHPLLGDELYGGRTDRFRRQALHCSNLQFIHPVTKEEMHFHSEIPEDIRL
ncbi:RluA family pseudouridine synthase [Bacillus sp. FJAT-49736]|uniref:RluA family pseudouridine synthase n=1 Tax=Bacillus sp. FJAT-49736 TaxID=2833582 RepID=UPI001BCA22DA|nr:RluA family pseudouridine synthase [Bacillus sp. FJAT-49736]